MVFKKHKYFLLAFLMMAVAGCKGQKMEEKFNWLGTVSAPEEYPMEVYKGALIAEDFTYGFDMIWGTQNTGWGVNGGVMSVSTQQMAAPDSLKFTWLSLTEKKFYTGSWKLDKEKIARLFREGYVNDMNQKKETYTMVKVGLAPKGRVMVWLTGSGFQTEVGAFLAHDTTITADMAYDNAKYMFKPGFVEGVLNNERIMKPEIKARIAQKGYPDPDIYAVYRERYQWRPEIHLPDGGKASLFFYSYLNGEEETRFGEELVSNPYQSRATPKYITLIWKDKTGKKNGLGIEPFDEDEVLAAFKKLGNTGNIDLVIKINSSNTNAVVSLKNNKEEIPLRKGKVDITENLD
ncbi:DUF2931 family protein [Pedobacter caeni]|uniref:DUF2931 family protein n=1 Tax=Pedobacter caeni TaxID=288992 RepID=A0A1M5F6T4_9SPHI|nr:DUF2931 family protein [Pedobacter caeni]SHF86761.1 Protein of unknown function [Pedobacter caeni]